MIDWIFVFKVVMILCGIAWAGVTIWGVYALISAPKGHEDAEGFHREP